MIYHPPPTRCGTAPTSTAIVPWALADVYFCAGWPSHTGRAPFWLDYQTSKTVRHTNSTWLCSDSLLPAIDHIQIWYRHAPRIVYTEATHRQPRNSTALAPFATHQPYLQFHLPEVNVGPSQRHPLPAAHPPLRTIESNTKQAHPVNHPVRSIATQMGAHLAMFVSALVPTRPRTSKSRTADIGGS